MLRLNWLKCHFTGSRNITFPWSVVGSEASPGPGAASCPAGEGIWYRGRSEKLLTGGAESTLPCSRKNPEVLTGWARVVVSLSIIFLALKTWATTPVFKRFLKAIFRVCGFFFCVYYLPCSSGQKHICISP